MANAKTGYGVSGSTDKYYGVSVDTDPGASGYWSESVYVKQSKEGVLFFSITEITGATVTLQFKDVGQTSWSDFDTYTTIPDSVIRIEHNPESQWRCGVADDNQGTSSSSQISW